MGLFSFRADEVAVVTGGAAGLGRALVRLLLNEGVRVASLDLNGDSEAGALPIVCDITDEAAVKASVRRIEETFGRIDMLANNAALVGRAVEAPLLEHSADLFRRVVDVNLTGQFLMLREVASVMHDRGIAGRIVNVASARALLGAPGIPGYSAAKAGLLGLTRSAAIELAPHGIRVNAVAPGFVGTELALREAGDERPWLDGKPIPLERIAEPVEVARLIAMLLSVDSGFATGATYTLDGGITAY